MQIDRLAALFYMYINLILCRDPSSSVFKDVFCFLLSDLLVLVMSLERKEVNGEEVVAAGKDSKDYLRILSKARYV